MPPSITVPGWAVISVGTWQTAQPIVLNSNSPFRAADVAASVAAITPEMTRRTSPYAARRPAQQERLQLPSFPTTTIGSFPQTSEVRQVRAALGRGELTGDEYDQAIEYAQGGLEVDPKNVEAGQKLFAANCVACHGENAKGNPELGAPNLTDKFWIYGGKFDAIDTTVWGGRQGQMPTWEGRLSELDRKILTLYLLDKRSANP